MKLSKLSQEEIELYRQWRVFAQQFSRDCALFDKMLYCIESFGQTFIADGDCLIEHSIDFITCPLLKPCSTKLMLRGECVCAFIEPIYSEEKNILLYFVEFIDTKRAFEIMTQTDMVLKLNPIYGLIRSYYSALQTSVDAIEKRVDTQNDSELSNAIFKIKQSVSYIGSLTNNAFEYISIASNKPSFKRLNVVSFCEMLVTRCNAVLAKCNRYINFYSEALELFVLFDARHALSALLNIMQNALIYSPRDSSPSIIIRRKAVGSCSYVEVRVLNETNTFQDDDFENIKNTRFSYQRVGFGNRIIEGFVNECGGELEVVQQDGKYILTMTFPEVVGTDTPFIHFEAPAENDFDNTISKMVEMKILNVVEIIKKFDF